MTTRWHKAGRVTAIDGVLTSGELFVALPVDPCPHGDPTCPCQDWGDPCHYEGPSKGPRGVVGAMECPNPPNPEGATYPHCHAEGCEASGAGCALQKLGLPSPTEHKRPAGSYLDALRGTPSWWCGVRRAVATELDSWPKK
jgi:hypothetical protein